MKLRKRQSKIFCFSRNLRWPLLESTHSWKLVVEVFTLSSDFFLIFEEYRVDKINEHSVEYKEDSTIRSKFTFLHLNQLRCRNRNNMYKLVKLILCTKTFIWSSTLPIHNSIRPSYVHSRFWSYRYCFNLNQRNKNPKYFWIYFFRLYTLSF